MCSGNKLDVASFFLADVEDLKEFSKSQGALEAGDLTHWDINFWSERLRESKYDINEVALLHSLSLSYHLEKKIFKENKV